MSKYEPLHRYLCERAGAETTMTFQELESILGFSLPNSARSYPAWWSNSVGTHVNAAAWREAGWKTSGVNLGGERVTFVRDEPAMGVAEASVPFDGASIRLSALSRSALAMIDDLAEETGGDRGSAVSAILDACARERRRQMIESLPVARMPPGHDSTTVIREDRDSR